jgi:hypothetical protein
MKVGVIVELVYQKILAGRLGLERDVKRVDIRAYLPAAINTTIRENYFTNLSVKDMLNISSLLPDQFISTYEDVEVKRNVNRNLKYIDFPAKPISLLESMGVNGILPMQGDDVEFYYTNNRMKLRGYDDIIGRTTFYWIEGYKAYFKNLSPVVTSVLVMMISSFTDLSDEDEVPVPLGFEEKVIANTYNWFAGQDLKTDDKLVDFSKDKNQQ